MSRTEFSRDEIVLRLRERNVPLANAEAAADHAIAERERLRGVEPPKKKRTRRPKQSKKGLDLEQRKFRLYCKENGLPMPTCEYLFALDAKPPRAFPFDFAWVEEKVAIEKQGGIWRKGGGAHTGTGHLRDMTKLNLAQLLGWRVLQRTPQKLCTPETIDLLKPLLTVSQEQPANG